MSDSPLDAITDVVDVFTASRQGCGIHGGEKRHAPQGGKPWRNVATFTCTACGLSFSLYPYEGKAKEHPLVSHSAGDVTCRSCQRFCLANAADETNRTAMEEAYQ